MNGITGGVGDPDAKHAGEGGESCSKGRVLIINTDMQLVQGGGFLWDTENGFHDGAALTERLLGVRPPHPYTWKHRSDSELVDV